MPFLFSIAPLVGLFFVDFASYRAAFLTLSAALAVATLMLLWAAIHRGRLALSPGAASR
jgi:hypothetical protein